MTHYQLFIKRSKTSKSIATKRLNEKDTLNFVRKAMLSIKSMDETVADLKAMHFLLSIKPGKARYIENSKNGHCLVIQIAK